MKRVSGQSLREFADARIFRPLGMNATHFHSDHTEIVRGRTSAYKPRAGGGYEISIPVFDPYGATSLFTTVGDLLKWEQNFIEPRVGGRAFVEAMLASGKLNRGAATGYGLGLISGRPRGVLDVGHAGSDAGYRTDVVQFPEHGLAIAVFCNLSSMRPALLSRKVAEIILGDAFTPLPSAVALPEAELQRLAGSYYNERIDDVRRLSVLDGKLTQTGSVDLWVPIGGGRFRSGETSNQIAFPRLSPVTPARQRPPRSRDLPTPRAARSLTR
ncbi:MAG: beta-lactamase family protein [Undibacterium sp.]|nr:beta-lactamase family protein [Opitutaceae bacterium]